MQNTSDELGGVQKTKERIRLKNIYLKIPFLRYKIVFKKIIFFIVILLVSMSVNLLI